MEGGADTKWESTYGAVRFLLPSEVKEVSNYLSTLHVEKVRARFDGRIDVPLHANGSAWTPDQWPLMWHYFVLVVEFFAQATAADEMLLLSSD